ncbi:MAG: hypothetical protein LBQ12_15135 [Deltaproteobacteria bacterium]|nr:hypothetical protein [Deltaproteobacteria bacterium]
MTVHTDRVLGTKVSGNYGKVLRGRTSSSSRTGDADGLLQAKLSPNGEAEATILIAMTIGHVEGLGEGNAKAARGPPARPRGPTARWRP